MALNFTGVKVACDLDKSSGIYYVLCIVSIGQIHKMYKFAIHSTLTHHCDVIIDHHIKHFINQLEKENEDVSVL